MADTTNPRTTSAEQEIDQQGSAGQSGKLSDTELRDEHKTPDDKGRAIEHGAEQYYRQEAPDAGPLETGAVPQSPGKPQPGGSAT